jgi:guanine deaminase
MPHEPTVTIFHGAIVNPVSLREYEALPNAAVAVGENGDIAWLVKDVLAEHGTIEKLLESHGCQNARPTVIPKGDFLVPGFVDTHTASAL